MTSDTSTPEFLTTIEIIEGLHEVARSPQDRGTVEMVVARPAVDERLTPSTGRLTIAEGLVGDRWKPRSSKRHGVNADQVTMINSRFLDHISAGDKSRWPLAGDQLVVDLDIGTANLPPGTRLQIGDALVDVTSKPHTGCSKFTARFGEDARSFANSEDGSRMRLRGLHVRVIQDGAVAVGDVLEKVVPPPKVD